jgi:hypothetical protein
MANHGYITTKKNLTAKRVVEDLQEINQRRFKGLLTVEVGRWKEKGSWVISYIESENSYPLGFNIWMTSKRKLEHRHAGGYAYYIELVFQEELGAKYNATFSDEGHSDKWKADPSKYPTYRSWLEVCYEHSLSEGGAHKTLAERCIADDMRRVPKALRGL